jgi:hypothetical protein
MSKHFSRRWAPLLISGASLALGAGCGKSEAATSRGPDVVTTPIAAGAKADTDTFTAEMKAAGAYKPSVEGTVEINLVPKGAYHTNAQYPYKFKIADPAPDGVTFPKATMVRADGTFEEKKGSFRLPFTAAKPGKYTIGGTLYLSVCSEANCIMDKVALEVPVEVK